MRGVRHATEGEALKKVRCSSLVEALVLDGLFRSAGMRSLVLDGHHVRLNWGSVPALGWVRLQVESDAEFDALELVNGGEAVEGVESVEDVERWLEDVRREKALCALWALFFLSPWLAIIGWVGRSLQTGRWSVS